MIINCTIELDSAVDSHLMITAVWKRNGITVMSSSSREVSDVTQSNSSLYLSQVVFRPFQLSIDDGVYSCQVTIDDAEDGFIQSTKLHSHNVSLFAAGIGTIIVAYQTCTSLYTCTLSKF